MKYRTVIVAAIVALAGAFASAQELAQRTATAAPTGSTASFPVVVMNGTGARVTGLDRSAFTVREKSTVLPIVEFWGPGEPTSLVFVVDVSHSIRPEDNTRALRTMDSIFAATSAGSQFAVVAVSGSVLVSGWETTSNALTGGMDFLQRMHQTGPAEGTSLHEGIARSLQLVTTGRFPRRAVIIISDGQDTRSRVSTSDVEKAIRRSPALVYTLVLQAGGSWAEDTILKKVEVTGGRKFNVAKDKDWMTAVDFITADLKHLHVLEVRLPAGVSDDKWHPVEVTVAESTARHTARSRTGYMRSQPNVALR